MSDTNPVSLRVAAKAVDMGERSVRAIVKSSGIGIRRGGSDKRPILRVHVEELRRVIDSMRYREARRGRNGRIVKLHPLVRC